MLSAILLAAAQLSAPVHLKYPVWFSLDDNPSRLEDEHVTRAVIVRAIVRPDGTLRSCEIEAASGDAAVDAMTCSLVQQRAHYAPATTQEGSPVYGVDRMRVMWGVVSSSKLRDADLVATVAELPRGSQLSAFLHAVVSVDETGSVTGCAADPSPWIHANKNEAGLIGIACTEITKRYRAIAVRDDSGNPVPSVQNVGIRIDRQR